MKYIFYHANCSDGFTAAWVFWWFVKGFRGATFVAENHNFTETLALLDSEHAHQAEIIYIDICPPRALLLRVEATVLDVQVLDHHETAQRECKDLFFCHFDMKHSGAMLAWRYAKNFDERLNAWAPALVKYVQDADLWQWKLPSARELVNVIHNMPHDFYTWTDLHFELAENQEAVVTRGETIQSVYDHQIERLLSQVFECSINTPSGLVRCGAVNSPIHQSELGNILDQEYPVAAVYHWERNCYKVSLRSGPNGPNVALIAEQFGGGGHHHAAGFRCKNIMDILHIA